MTRYPLRVTGFDGLARENLMKNSLAAVFPLVVVQGFAAVFRIGVGLVNRDSQEHIIGY